MSIEHLKIPQVVDELLSISTAGVWCKIEVSTPKTDFDSGRKQAKVLDTLLSTEWL